MSEQHPGLTDAAVTQGHDFIEHAEVEEAQSHGNTAPAAEQKSNTSGGTTQDHKEHSKLDKVKEALHMKK